MPRSFTNKRNDIRLILDVAKREGQDLGASILTDVADGAAEGAEAMATANGYFDQLQVQVMDGTVDESRFASNLDTVKASLTKKLLAIKNEKLKKIIHGFLDSAFRMIEGIAKGFGKAIGLPIA